MKILRRLAAMVAIAALTAPLLGAGNGVRGSAAYNGETATAHAAMADMAKQDSGHCGDRAGNESDAPAPCDHSDAAACPSMSSCTISSAMMLEPTCGNAEIPRMTAHFGVERKIAGESASPDPPPPRA